MIELRVSGLLLAPRSTPETRPRAGGNKSIISHWIDLILAAGIGDTVIVIDPRSSSLVNAFTDLPVRFVVHSDSTDRIQAVRAGMQELGDSASGILLCLGDHQAASVRTLRSLALEHYAFCNRIIVPVYGGKPRNPVLFPRTIMNEVSSGISLQEAVRKDPKRVRLLEVRGEEAEFETEEQGYHDTSIRGTVTPLRRPVRPEILFH